MISFSARSFLAFGLLSSSALAATLLACGDDDPVAPVANDAGADTGPRVDGGGTTCPPAAEPTCTAEKCTATNGEESVCVAGACVKMKSQDCSKVGGDLKGANVVVVGASLAQNGANQASGEARINSLKLAIDEINASGGIRDPDKCKPARTLAYVACDDANKPATVDGGAPEIDRTRGAQHLINDLKVAVIVGASTSGNTLDLADKATMPARVMQFAPSSTAIAITQTTFPSSFDGTRLLWRAAPSDKVQSLVLRELFTALAGATPKLALVTKNDAYGKGIQQAFKEGFTIGGADPTAANFVDIQYKTAPTDLDGVVRSTAVTQLQAFAPTIIVMAGTSEATDEIIRPYEAANPAVKPIYILADGQKKPELTRLLEPGDTSGLPAPSDRAGLRTRIRGTQPGVVSALAQSFFNIGYKTAYGDTSVLSYGMAGTYDIGYMIAYAIAATKGGEISGIALAKNMALLSEVGGTKIDVGKSSFSRGIDAMLKGEKVDFNGASGPLDFDLATGEAPSDYSIWCVKPDPSNANARIYEEQTGQSYSATEKKLTGTYACP